MYRTIPHLLIVFFFVGLAVDSIHAQVTPDFADVPYATLHERNVLDIYLPDGFPGPHPVVVWIHGGAWLGGDKSSAAGRAAQLLPLGFAVVGINYRLSQHEIFPAQIHDCKGAIRWLRANAAIYNLDPNRIGVWGSSAGGHLVSLVGTSGGVAAAEGNVGGNLGFSSRVQAVADYFGPTDLLHIQLDVTTPPGSAFNHDDPGSPESRLIGFDDPGQGIGVLRANQSNPSPPFPEKMALVILADPIVHATADDPPFYIAHGTVDTTVPMGQSTKLATRLSQLGVEHTYNIVSGAGHGMPPSVDSLVVDFFEEKLLVSGPVPATSFWTMVVMGCLITIGGTIVSKRNSQKHYHSS